MAAVWIDTTVEGLRDLSPTVREFTLRAMGGASAWTVGSHLRVQVLHSDGRRDERRYSLLGLPGAAIYRIAVKRVAPSRGGSAFMWRLGVGDHINTQAPFNHFELPLPSHTSAPQTLLMAGGIGITPTYGMALVLAARGADVAMAYAVRDESEAIFADELRGALGARLRLFNDAAGERMDIDAQIAALHAQGQLLVCGPVPLLHAVQAAWQRSGRPPQRLRFETFGNSGALPTVAFRVQVPRHGVDVEVGADRSLLDVLEAAGVPMLYDCKRGECGLCAVDILACHGAIDHRDMFFSAEEKRLSKRLCTCVSRLSGGTLVIDSAYRPEQPG